jgi:integral membrane sensor domain MASE1
MVTPLVLAFVYLVFCILVGICGSTRRMGFLGTFFLSIFVTPVLVLILLLITGPSRLEMDRARRAIDS